VLSKYPPASQRILYFSENIVVLKVKVRFLIDDIFTPGVDHLQAHRIGDTPHVLS
jgi:hypothetical protein